MHSIVSNTNNYDTDVKNTSNEIDSGDNDEVESFKSFSSDDMDNEI